MIFKRDHLRGDGAERHAAFENAQFRALEVRAGKLRQNRGIFDAGAAPILGVEENSRVGEALVERKSAESARRTAAQEIEFHGGFAGLLAQGEAHVDGLVVGRRFERLPGLFVGFRAEKQQAGRWLGQRIAHRSAFTASAG